MDYWHNCLVITSKMETPKPEKKEQCLEDSLADEKPTPASPMRSGQFWVVDGRSSIAARYLPSQTSECGTEWSAQKLPPLPPELCWSKDLRALEQVNSRHTPFSARLRSSAIAIRVGYCSTSLLIYRLYRRLRGALGLPLKSVGDSKND